MNNKNKISQPKEINRPILETILDPQKELENEIRHASGHTTQSHIHLRIQKRTARKSITVVEGLSVETLDLTKILKSIKRTFSCNGTIITRMVDDREIKFLQLSGDQRQNVKDFLIREKLATKDKIVVHGY
jgi:translation initiation factor 1